MVRAWKRPRVFSVSRPPVSASTWPSTPAGPAQVSAPQQKDHTVAQADWLRFLAPEIKLAQAAFADEPMLMNTMCSGIGAPTTALEVPAAVENKNQQQCQHTHAQATTDITACDPHVCKQLTYRRCRSRSSRQLLLIPSLQPCSSETRCSGWVWPSGPSITSLTSWTPCTAAPAARPMGRSAYGKMARDGRESRPA